MRVVPRTLGGISRAAFFPARASTSRARSPPSASPRASLRTKRTTGLLRAFSRLAGKFLKFAAKDARMGGAKGLGANFLTGVANRAQRRDAAIRTPSLIAPSGKSSAAQTITGAAKQNGLPRSTATRSPMMWRRTETRPALRPCLALGFRLLDAALQAARIRGELAVRLIEEIGIEPAIVLDRADGAGREPQPHRMTQRVRQHGRALQIGEEAALRLVVGVADIVADLNAFTRDDAPPRHDTPSLGEAIF